MTENGWNGATVPEEMLIHLRGKTSDRKLRLFACLCCRRIWHLFTDERMHNAVEAAERYAEALASREQLSAALSLTFEMQRRGGFHSAAHLAAGTAGAACGADAWAAAWNVVSETRRMLREVRPEMIVLLEGRGQAVLLRHMIGNPFRPGARPEHWASACTGLAQALYAGEDVAGPLADALEEAGHIDLARHFRDEPNHPRGCWALDTILGKS